MQLLARARALNPSVWAKLRHSHALNGPREGKLGRCPLLIQALGLLTLLLPTQGGSSGAYCGSGMPVKASKSGGATLACGQEAVRLAVFWSCTQLGPACKVLESSACVLDKGHGGPEGPDCAGKS